MKKLLCNSLLVAVSMATLFTVPSFADCADGAKCAKQGAQVQCQEKGECQKDMKCADGQKAMKCKKNRCAKAGKKAFRHGKKQHAGGAYRNMVRSLDLTEEQSAKVDPIVKKYAEQAKELSDKQASERSKIMVSAKDENGKRVKMSDEQKAKLKGIHKQYAEAKKANLEAFKKEVAPILSAEQNEKLNNYKPHKAMNHRSFKGGKHMGRGHKGKMMGHKAQFGPEHMVKMLDENLNLSADQKAKVTEIVKKHDAERRQSQKEALEKMKAQREAFEKDIDSVLTKEQKEKAAQMRENSFKGCPKGMHRMGKGACAEREIGEGGRVEVTCSK